MSPHVCVPVGRLASAARPLVGARREKVPQTLDGVEGIARNKDSGGYAAMPSSPLGPVGLYCPAVDAPLPSQSDRAEPEHERPRERAVRARAEACALLEQPSEERTSGARKRHEPDAAAQRCKFLSFEPARPATVAHKLTERNQTRPAVEAGVWSAVHYCRQLRHITVQRRFMVMRHTWAAFWLPRESMT